MDKLNPLEEDALKPCPFCGGEAKTHGPYGWYGQWCITHNCEVFYNGGSEAFKNYPNEAYAIAAWNTRPTSSGEEVIRAANEKMVERGARAIVIFHGNNPDALSRDEDVPVWTYYRGAVEAVLLATSPPTQPAQEEVIRALVEVLTRLSKLTPERANAVMARDLHLTVKAIADTALANVQSQQGETR